MGFRGVMAALAMLFASSASAGTFSVTPFTNDATSGVSAANVYTHAINWAGPAVTVNGVPFTPAPSQIGPTYGLGRVPNVFNNSPNNNVVPVTDGFRTLFNNFFYGNANTTEYVTLNGLVPGWTYSTRFYSTPWGGPRVQQVESQTSMTVFDEDATTQYLDYTFVASGYSNTIKFTGQSTPAASNHHYAMTNQLVTNVEQGPLFQVQRVYNTGVDNAGLPLPNAANTADPHYTLVANPHNGSNVAVVHDTSISPISNSTWMPNTTSSKWIAPVFNASTGAVGIYTYRTTVDLTGFQASTAQLTGKWASDNPGRAIRVNGQPVTGVANLVASSFANSVPFSIPAGMFSPGLNTIEFDVENLSPAGFTGLRVDELEVKAAVTPGYVRVPSAYNTGVDNAGVVLAPGTPDPHYQFVFTDDPNISPPVAGTVQQNHPAWSANDAVGTVGSSYISTIPDGTSNIPPGQYIFETTFDLTGYVDSTAFLHGRFAADNRISDILLNGVSTNVAGFGHATLAGFSIESGFLPGVNTLTFLAANDPPNANPGGFRVELDAFAVPVPEPGSLVLAGLGISALLAVGFRKKR
jgi:hypothetical protein